MPVVVRPARRRPALSCTGGRPVRRPAGGHPVVRVVGDSPSRRRPVGLRLTAGGPPRVGDGPLLGAHAQKTRQLRTHLSPGDPYI